MQPRGRNTVGHVGAADAEVQALAVRKIFIQPEEEPIGWTCHRYCVHPVIAVTRWLPACGSERAKEIM